MVYLWADHSLTLKSVIASNNCTNSDAGIYNMHQCDAVKGGYSSFVLNITMKKLLSRGLECTTQEET